MNIYFNTDLRYRAIPRGGDIDYFIDTQSYPIDLELDINKLSRIQFPTARAILLRTSPITSLITIHILQDTDLYSSCANFELNLEGNKLDIFECNGLIKIKL